MSSHTYEYLDGQTRNRKERIDTGVPYIDMDFSTLKDEY